MGQEPDLERIRRQHSHNGEEQQRYQVHEALLHGRREVEVPPEPEAHDICSDGEAHEVRHEPALALLGVDHVLLQRLDLRLQPLQHRLRGLFFL